jgi:glycosyltransferase involved in cell wall biosynthesis
VLNDGQIGCGTVYRGFDIAPIALKPFRFRKISFCVTSMNRLHHLSQTLSRNLADNRSYPNLEVVLLDYNSSDGLEKWTKEHMLGWIDAGRLIYFRTIDHAHFRRSHARNLAFRLATGDIVCTVDADNFTGPGFAHYVNERFSRYEDIYLRPDFEGAHLRLRDVFGRVCLRKADFLSIESYDEGIVEYGYEDVDLCSRLEKRGLKPKFIEDDRFLRYIEHSNRERVANGPILRQVVVFLRGRESGERHESLLYLLEDGGFLWLGPRVDGLPMHGRWRLGVSKLQLTCEQGVSASLRVGENGNSYFLERPSSELCMRPSNDFDFSSDSILEYVLSRNGQKHRSNVERMDYCVNAGSFGKANVSRNFSLQTVAVEALGG